MPIELEQIFHHARTAYAFEPLDVAASTMHRLYDTLKWGPTSANCSPARFLFVASAAAKDRLLPTLFPRNREKASQAAVTVIVGMDMDFPERLPELMPHVDARAIFAGNPELIESTAFRNSSLQGAYLIVAARALGLDCGPMSGFDGAAVDAEFWAGTAVKTNFLVNLGKADARKAFPRSPRLSFDDACRIL